MHICDIYIYIYIYILVYIHIFAYISYYIYIYIYIFILFILCIDNVYVCILNHSWTSNLNCLFVCFVISKSLQETF